MTFGTENSLFNWHSAHGSLVIAGPTERGLVCTAVKGNCQVLILPVLMKHRGIQSSITVRFVHCCSWLWMWADNPNVGKRRSIVKFNLLTLTSQSVFGMSAMQLSARNHFYKQPATNPLAPFIPLIEFPSQKDIDLIWRTGSIQS